MGLPLSLSKDPNTVDNSFYSSKELKVNINVRITATNLAYKSGWPTRWYDIETRLANGTLKKVARRYTDFENL